MIHNCVREKITVVQLGTMEINRVVNIFYRANEIQRAFYFDCDMIEKNRLPLEDKFKLPNGAYDLCGAVESAFNSGALKNLPRPLLIVSEVPLGDPEHPEDPDYVYSSSQETDYDPWISILSTDTEGLRNRTLESYLFMLLATHILSVYVDISFHSPPQGCPLGYCEDDEDLENCFAVGKLCDDCEHEVQDRLQRQKVSVERVAAALRLLNRSVGRKYCFVVMPFSRKLNIVYETVRSTLIDCGWDIKRADEIALGNIKEVILKEILISDLVLADLTGLNPNVLYEVGLANALGNSLLLLTQEPLPIDLSHEQAVFYKIDNLNELKFPLQRRLQLGRRK